MFNTEERLRTRVKLWLGRRVRPNGLQEVAELNAAIGTATGEVRDSNQDRAVLLRLNPVSNHERPLMAAVLCDGVGGLMDGGECAELALASFVASMASNPNLELGQLVRSAVQSANLAVHRAYGGRGGTTMVGMVVSLTQGVGFSVGDSRAYALTDGRTLTQLSVDDTIGEEIQRLKGSKALPEGLLPYARHLVQYIGIGEDLVTNVFVLPGDIRGLILTSDGAHSSPYPVLSGLFAHATDAVTAVNRTIQLSRWLGGGDNATMIWVSPSQNWKIQDPSGLRHLEVWDSFAKIDLDVGTEQETTNPTAKQQDKGTQRAPKFVPGSKRATGKQSKPAVKRERDKKNPKPALANERTLEIEVQSDQSDDVIDPSVGSEPEPETSEVLENIG